MFLIPSEHRIIAPEPISIDVTFTGPPGRSVILPVFMALLQAEVFEDLQIFIAEPHIYRLHVFGIPEADQARLKAILSREFLSAVQHFNPGPMEVSYQFESVA